jgi:hypothetical protein
MKQNSKQSVPVAPNYSNRSEEMKVESFLTSLKELLLDGIDRREKQGKITPEKKAMMLVEMDNYLLRKRAELTFNIYVSEILASVLNSPELRKQLKSLA